MIYPNDLGYRNVDCPASRTRATPRLDGMTRGVADRPRLRTQERALRAFPAGPYGLPEAEIARGEPLRFRRSAGISLRCVSTQARRRPPLGRCARETDASRDRLPLLGPGHAKSQDDRSP